MLKYLLEVVVFCSVEAFALFIYWIAGGEMIRCFGLAWTLLGGTFVGLYFALVVVGVRHIK